MAMSRDCGSFTEMEKRPFSSVPMKRNAFFFTFIALCPHGNSSYASGNFSANSRSFDSILPPLDFAMSIRPGYEDLRSICVICGLLPLEHHRYADSAGGADGDEAVLLAGVLELVADGGDDARAGCAEGVAERD